MDTLFWSKKIKNSLEQFNIFCNKVSANFLLLNFNKCKLNANNVEKKLLTKGLILRETKTYGIKNCLRLTIGNNLENKKLMPKWCRFGDVNMTCFICW